ncbi:MAG: nitroreductase family protein [Candidatus Thorarchaeota archaeon]
MDVMEAILGRRSIRKYKSSPVEKEKVDKILEAARWAPSASNLQPWHFIVVRDESTRSQMAKAHPHGRFMSESPVVIVVLGDPSRHPKYHLCDPHNAVQNMLLAAYSMGLGTCWIGVRDSDVEPRIREILGIPDTLRVICCVSVGYPDGSGSSSRLPLDQLVSYEAYGAKERQ